MIRVDPDPGVVLSPEEDYGLAALVDLSRLLVLEDRTGAHSPDIVRVSVTPTVAADRVEDPGDVARGKWTFAVRDGEVGISRALLARVTALAGAGVEQRSSARDRQGRVPSSENPLVADGDFRDPVVSRCAAALRDAVIQAAARRPVWVLDPWPDGKRWCAAMTHDLDLVAWWPLATGLRLVELLGGGHPVRAAHVVASAFLGALSTALDDAPVRHGVQGVLAVEAALGVRSTWFVIAGTPSVASLRAGDVTYRPESRAARRILAAVWSGGDEIGLHGSFATAEDAAVFAVQRSRLRAASEGETAGVRQHYLKMRPGLTQRGMAAAGFTYDATYGFPDRNGFRLGVADVVPGWDERLRQSTTLDEVPLMWMDRAQSKYQGIEDPAHWVDDALELARACESVEGLWVGLWHPNLTPALGFPGAPSAYRRLMVSLVERDPYVATLDRIVAWRRFRRSVRAKGIAPDGRVELTEPQSDAAGDAFRASVRALTAMTPP